LELVVQQKLLLAMAMTVLMVVFAGLAHTSIL
jgi:hypothetical protein